MRLIRKEGATRWAEINRLPVTWQGSEALLYFISDITESKEARESLEGMNVHLEDMVEQRTRELMQRSEELLREAEKLKRADAEKTELLKKLERSKKMESLGMLAGGVAHDLNNVLSGIVTYPELILLGLPEDSPMRDPIRLLRDSGQKAAAIVEDLLALAHKGPPSTTTLNINRDVVLEFLESPGIHPDQELRCEYTGGNRSGPASPFNQGLALPSEENAREPVRQCRRSSTGRRQDYRRHPEQIP